MDAGPRHSGHAVSPGSTPGPLSGEGQRQAQPRRRWPGLMKNGVSSPPSLGAAFLMAKMAYGSHVSQSSLRRLAKACSVSPRTPSNR